MRLLNVGLIAMLFCTSSLLAQTEDSIVFDMSQLEEKFTYQTGKIEFTNEHAFLNVPKGFKFLDAQQSIYVLTELWGNPPDSSILGMLVPANGKLLDDNSWVFTIQFEEIGYVEDDDADDIDYDDLLEDLQKETLESNPARIQAGYSKIELIGWAAAPYYDKDKKVLHWAKELKFDENETHTLNYNLRVLGKDGVFFINAISGMQALPQVEASMEEIVSCVSFEKGNTYFDFDPEVDQVAAWSLGGLVAGKVLAKAGLLAGLAKFGKVILFGLIAAVSAAWKFITGKKSKKEEETTTPENTSPPSVS